MRLRRSVGRSLAGVIVLFLLFAAIIVALPAPQAVAALTATTQADPGTTVEVTGRGYLPLVQVTLCWGEPGCEDLGTANTGLGTTFTSAVTIPSDAEPGTNAIYACQLSCESTSIDVLAEEQPTTTTTTSTTSTTSTTNTTTSSPSSTTTSTTTSSPSSTTTTTPQATTSTVVETTTSPGDTATEPTPAGEATTTTERPAQDGETSTTAPTVAREYRVSVDSDDDRGGAGVGSDATRSGGSPPAGTTDSDGEGQIEAAGPTPALQKTAIRSGSWFGSITTVALWLAICTAALIAYYIAASRLMDRLERPHREV